MWQCARMWRLMRHGRGRDLDGVDVVVFRLRRIAGLRAPTRDVLIEASWGGQRFVGALAHRGSAGGGKRAAGARRSASVAIERAAGLLVERLRPACGSCRCVPTRWPPMRRARGGGVLD